MKPFSVVQLQWKYLCSFKERGARNTLELLSQVSVLLLCNELALHSALSLLQEQRKQGVISASAGNHALALAYHGQLLGIPVVVVTPVTAPIMKVTNSAITSLMGGYISHYIMGSGET